MGPGVGLHVGLAETLRLRAQGSYVPYSYDRSLDDDEVDARADGDVQLGGPEVRLDWHPLASSFHLSAGVLYNLTSADALVFPASEFEFSDTKTFSEERVGELDAEVSYGSPISPYAGIGFGDALSSRWGMRVELGAYYVGSPEFDFEGEGLIKATERNEVVLEEGFASFQFFPHLSVGLSYQF